MRAPEPGSVPAFGGFLITPTVGTIPPGAQIVDFHLHSSQAMPNFDVPVPISYGP
jgi:hypothetical protein